MSTGRGSARLQIAAIAGALLFVLANLESVRATSYTVGGAGRWKFNVNNWPKGKHFRAGDALIFNYKPALHNVVVVDRKSYTKCKTPARAKIYRSGKDKIRLFKGQNNFICNLPGHCESGMKISIVAV